MTRFQRGLALACMVLPLWAQAGQRVDINTASAEEIATSLDGVGMAKAQAIVQYRSDHGPFRAVDDLVSVKGIGRATLDRNREFVVLGAKATPSSKSTADVSK